MNSDKTIFMTLKAIIVIIIKIIMKGRAIVMMTENPLTLFATMFVDETQS